MKDSSCASAAELSVPNSLVERGLTVLGSETGADLPETLQTSLFRSAEASQINELWNQRVEGLVEVRRRYLLHPALLRAGSTTAGCSGLCPAGF